MRRLIFTAFAVIVFSVANAQSKSANSSTYRSALGVKVWDGAGITFKHFFNPQNAGELIAYFWQHGMRITGLFEIHGNISGAPGLKWYVAPVSMLDIMMPATIIGIIIILIAIP
jgi:hypothetical protein